jgi:hypothetical protein
MESMDASFSEALGNRRGTNEEADKEDVLPQPVSPQSPKPQLCPECGAEKVIDYELGGFSCPNYCAFRLPRGGAI